MNTFAVRVRTLFRSYSYAAIGTCSATVHAEAIERFGGLCSITVIPL